jgi:hypothetical protein
MQIEGMGQQKPWIQYGPRAVLSRQN